MYNKIEFFVLMSNQLTIFSILLVFKSFFVSLPPVLVALFIIKILSKRYVEQIS